MELMKSLKSGLPTPHRVIMDLENCFHHIPLHPDDCKRFLKQYHWKFCLKEWLIVLPYVEKKVLSLLQYKKLGL